ncbi:Ig-like domain repeat protein [Rhodococcus sp. NPDC055112]
MRSTRARRAAMIGTAAVLLVAPCVALAQAEPTPPAPALPADMVAAIQRDLGLNPAQYLEQADTGQELLRFADTLRGKFPTAFAGVWLDAAGAPLVGLADGPDKAAARTAVEAAGYQVKDQARSEQALSGLLGQLNTWVQQLPAPLAGLINGTAIDPAANDIALEVKDTAEGQALQLPDFLNFVHVAKGPAGSSEMPGLGSLGSSDPTKPTTTKPTEPTTTKPTEPTTTKPTEPTTTKPTEPTTTTTKPTTNPVASAVALDPITAAPGTNEYTLTAKVTPVAAGGTVEFKDGTTVLGTTQVKADGTAARIWYPETNGKHTITATFSGRNGVTGSTTTAQVTVTTVDNTTPMPTTTKPTEPTKPLAADAVLGGDEYGTENENGDKSLCSFGFNGTDASGHAVNISAGHCDKDAAEAGTLYASIAFEVIGDRFENRYGTFDKTVMNGSDYSVIKIDDNVAKRFENNFVRAPGSAPVAITGTADPVVGAPACKSGKSTGYTCGKITRINERRTLGSAKLNNAFGANLCSGHGDSGGPVLTGTKALGILNGSTIPCGGSLSTISVPIKEILKENPGLKIRTN